MALTQLPTVRVKHATAGYAVINASDFDSSLHELYAGPIPIEEEFEDELPAASIHQAESLDAPVLQNGEPVIPDFTGADKKKRK